MFSVGQLFINGAYIAYIVLSVRVHLDDKIVIVIDRVLVACLQRHTVAHVVDMRDNNGASFFGDRFRVVA